MSHNISFVAGVTLRYSGGDTVPADYGGTGSTAGRRLCFELDLKCDPLTSYFQLPVLDAVLSSNGEPCLRARYVSCRPCFCACLFSLLFFTFRVVVHALSFQG